MSDVSIPQEYWMHVDSSNGMTMGGGIRMTVDPVTMTAIGDVNQPIATVMTGNPEKPIGTRVTGDPKQPVATTIDMLNIPHLTLNDIKDIMTPKLRVHMPNYEQMSFKLFGVEVFSVCLSGEMQMITQPFTPNAYETCKIECPDVDTRPFPETPVFDRGKEIFTNDMSMKADGTGGEEK